MSSANQNLPGKPKAPAAFAPAPLLDVMVARLGSSFQASLKAAMLWLGQRLHGVARCCECLARDGSEDTPRRFWIYYLDRTSKLCRQSWIASPQVLQFEWSGKESSPPCGVLNQGLDLSSCALTPNDQSSPTAG